MNFHLSKHKDSGQTLINNLQSYSKRYSSRQTRKSIFENRLSTHHLKTQSTHRKIFEQRKQQVVHYPNKSKICYDFCGCQNNTFPCQIIQKKFLNEISLLQMKMEYENIQRSWNITQKQFKDTRRQLFGLLPKLYPQTYLAHLNNLLVNLGIYQITVFQFLCLAWVQYHSKIQYITYFLYSDLKKSFINLNKFTGALSCCLEKMGSSLNKVALQYWQNIFNLNNFLKIYYESIAAILIPITRYAKFLVILTSRGPKALVRLLILFFIKKKQETKIICKYLYKGKVQLLRDYLQELNWDSCFEYLQKDK